MLSFAQAMTISRDCIRSVSGAKVINQGDVLDALGITDDERIELVKDAVVEDDSIGVPSTGHTIQMEDLGKTKTSSTAGDLAQAIFDNAKENEG